MDWREGEGREENRAFQRESPVLDDATIPSCHILCYILSDILSHNSPCSLDPWRPSITDRAIIFLGSATTNVNRLDGSAMVPEL